jgi:hypothetical protein
MRNDELPGEIANVDLGTEAKLRAAQKGRARVLFGRLEPIATV